jgi:hypothetical protein
VYLDKMQAHTSHGKLVHDLEKILVDKKVDLYRREWDLELHAATLAEVQSWGLNPQDNHDELMEFIKLQGLLRDIEVDRAIEGRWLATLVGDVS